MSDAPLPESEYFCVLPWLHLALFPEGSAKLCCVSGSCVSTGGDPLSLQTDTLADIWNSSYMRGVRRDMFAGKPVAECSACYLVEKSGGVSYRKQNNARWAAELGPLLDAIVESSQIENFAAPAPIFYQLMPGNLCNLKCRMCMPVFSSQIERDPVHSEWAPPLLEHTGRPALDWTTGRVSLAPLQLRGVRHTGFHALEDRADRPFRWTSGRALAALPLPDGVRADAVRLALLCNSPTQPQVRVRINGVIVSDARISRRGLDRTFRVPAEARDLTVELECEPIRVMGDPRELGVAVEAIELIHSVRPADIRQPGKQRDDEARRLPNGPWYRDDAWVRDVLLANAAELRGLYFTGGEPMLEKQVEYILDQLIARGAADRVDLELNTNCTALRAPVLSKMLQFRHLTLGLSIDAYGATYEYIRYPARWEKVRRNVERLSALPRDRLELVATVVLQVNNALDVVRVLQFFDEMNIGFNIQIATMPWFLGVGVLPASVRALAVTRLQEYADRQCKPHNRAQVLSVIDQVERLTDRCTPDALRTLMLFSNDLDATRRQNTRAVHGELLQLLAAEGFHWTEERSLAKAPRKLDQRYPEMVLGGAQVRQA